MDVYHEAREFLALLETRLTAPPAVRDPADGSDPDRIVAVRTALSVCPRRAVVGFQTAADLLGFGVLPSREVHIVVPAGTPCPQRRGIRAHQSVVPVGEPVDVAGIPCTPAARCAIDLARTVSRIDALPILDAALRSGACDADHLLAELAAHDGLRGVRQVRPLVDLADPRPQCRQESQLRLILHDGRILGFEPRVPVTDETGAARHVIGLAHPGSRVGLEYEGDRRDPARHEWLEGRGWTMRYFTDRHIYADPASIVATVVDALRSARRGRATGSMQQFP
jgi:hypothetical protein